MKYGDHQQKRQKLQKHLLTVDIFVVVDLIKSLSGRHSSLSMTLLLLHECDEA